jgi:hypothetical protein
MKSFELLVTRMSLALFGVLLDAATNPPILRVPRAGVLAHIAAGVFYPAYIALNGPDRLCQLDEGFSDQFDLLVSCLVCAQGGFREGLSRRCAQVFDSRTLFSENCADRFGRLFASFL